MEVLSLSGREEGGPVESRGSTADSAGSFLSFGTAGSQNQESKITREEILHPKTMREVSPTSRFFGKTERAIEMARYGKRLGTAVVKKLRK